MSSFEMLYGKKRGGDVKELQSLVNLSVFAVIFERCLLVHSKKRDYKQG